MSSNIWPRVKLVPPIVDQVTILSKGELCLQPSRIVQRLKEAPKRAFLSRRTLGGDKRIRWKWRITPGWSSAVKQWYEGCRDRL